MKTIKKIVFFLIIILIILIGAILVINFNPITRELSYIYNDNKQQEINIMPTNVSYVFQNYAGNVSQMSIYKAIDIYSNNKIEKYYKLLGDINEIGVTEYYNKNSKNILKELGIENEEQFDSFIREIEKLNGDSIILEEYTFYPKKFSRKSGYVEGIVILKYSNNEKISFNIRILNKKDKNRTPISFVGDVEDKYYEYEYEPIQNDGPTIDSPGKVAN